MSESVRISKTVAFLLRHRPEMGGLTLDDAGWVEVRALSVSVSKLLGAEVEVERLIAACTEGQVRRFELDSDRIRSARQDEPRDTAVPRPSERELTRFEADHRRVHPPDILYHATTDGEVERFLVHGEVSAGPDRHVFLSPDEAQAWRVAHRMTTGAPRVLYVDAARARRHGVKFYRNRRNGLYLCTPVPAGDVLNLQPNFAEQVSAGGIPYTFGPGGIRVALIRVGRKSGITWEVAKGKLELGEAPEHAAIREVREEMGVTSDLRITASLGMVRYGFLAPGGLPRLKTVHLYLMEPTSPIEAFLPAENEGIGAVQWFSLDEACRAVTHSSLVPLMRKACALLSDMRAGSY